MIRLLRWMGGKVRVAHLINQLMPDTRMYVEPFVGAGGIIQNVVRHEIEVINDLNPGLAALHKTLAGGRADEFIEMLASCGTSKEDFQKSVQYTVKYGKAKVSGLSEESLFELAKHTYIRYSLSFAGGGRSYSGDAAARFKGDIYFHLPAIKNRYQGVQAEHGDGIALVEKYKDEEDVFLPCDPPYDMNLRPCKKIYANEMGQEGQERLMGALKDAKGKAMLFGYIGQDGTCYYDQQLLPTGRWKRYKLAELPKSCQSKEKKDFGQEHIWVNYELPASARFVIDMSTEVTSL